VPAAASERAPAAAITGVLPPPLPKTALVTGAGQRIGRTLALSLAEAGFAVAVHYNRSRAAAEAAAAAIRAKGGNAAPLSADLADETATRGLLRAAEQALGPVGVLVNNAGVFVEDTVETATRKS
jgi:NAD(P)-dependent dehydrogenase (short-subunit alcohol dehydrogenase family)